MNLSKISRRTWFIDRGFQLKYTLLLVGAGTFVSLLFGEMMYVTNVNAMRSMPVTDAIHVQLAQSENGLLLLMFTVSLLMAAALGLFGVLITHRVAGPVYVMSHYVGVLAQGRYPIMRELRKADELKEFFERFRGALETMRVREADEAAQLEQAVALFRPVAGNPESLALLQQLESIAQRKRDATDRVALTAQAQKAAQQAPVPPAGQPQA